MTDLIMRAALFAARAHSDQIRKYTGEPYINHPIEVASIVATVEHTPEMLAASLLHDVVEDTFFTLDDIYREFGQPVRALVYWLTDVSKPEHGNRAQRKEIDRRHMAAAPAKAQTIKLADLISNTSTIAKHDPGFARVYLEEKRLLLEVLTKGDETLLERAWSQI